MTGCELQGPCGRVWAVKDGWRLESDQEQIQPSQDEVQMKDNLGVMGILQQLPWDRGTRPGDPLDRWWGHGCECAEAEGAACQGPWNFVPPNSAC